MYAPEYMMYAHVSRPVPLGGSRLSGTRAQSTSEEAAGGGGGGAHARAAGAALTAGKCLIGVRGKWMRTQHEECEQQAGAGARNQARRPPISAVFPPPPPEKAPSPEGGGRAPGRPPVSWQCNFRRSALDVRSLRRCVVCCGAVGSGSR
jgi:hypothetical protein